MDELYLGYSCVMDVGVLLRGSGAVADTDTGRWRTRGASRVMLTPSSANTSDSRDQVVGSTRPLTPLRLWPCPCPPRNSPTAAGLLSGAISTSTPSQSQQANPSTSVAPTSPDPRERQLHPGTLPRSSSRFAQASPRSVHHHSLSPYIYHPSRRRTPRRMTAHHL